MPTKTYDRNTDSNPAATPNDCPTAGVLTLYAYNGQQPGDPSTGTWSAAPWTFPVSPSYGFLIAAQVYIGDGCYGSQVNQGDTLDVEATNLSPANARFRLWVRSGGIAVQSLDPCTVTLTITDQNTGAIGTAAVTFQ